MKCFRSPEEESSHWLVFGTVDKLQWKKILNELESEEESVGYS
jgi:hypothetical protein